MASRYETATIVAWVSLLAFFAVNAKTMIQRALLYIAWAAAAVIVVPYQSQAIQPLAQRTFDLGAAGLALRAGLYDSPITKILYPDAAKLESIAREAQKDGLSIFATNSPDYPEYLSPFKASDTCLGNIERISKASERSTLAQISGWAYGRDGKPPAQIIFTDPDGRAIGYGVTGAPRPDLAKNTGTEDFRIGWLGFFAPRLDYVAVVVSQDGRRCFIPH